MEHVNLFDFTSYHSYLEAIFQSRKHKNPNYSMRKFSSDLGFSSSGYASALIKGSYKLTDASIAKIANSLKLKGKKRDYFKILVKLSECDESEKNTLMKKAATINQSLSNLIIDDSLAYYLENSACRHITLLVQIFREEFIAEPLWVARHLRSDVPLDDINRALNYLIKHNFIKKVDGVFVNSQNNISSSDEIPSQSIKKAQQDLLNEAIEALQCPIQEREYGNITIPIYKSVVPSLKEKMKQNREELKLWVSLRNQEASEVEKDGILAVSINFQMYPASKLRKVR